MKEIIKKRKERKNLMFCFNFSCLFDLQGVKNKVKGGKGGEGKMSSCSLLTHLFCFSFSFTFFKGNSHNMHCHLTFQSKDLKTAAVKCIVAICQH